MKTALTRASNYIAPSDGLEGDPHVCKDCGCPIPEFATYCDVCIQKSISDVVLENSTRRLSAENPDVIALDVRTVACGAGSCIDCPMADHPEECEGFVQFLQPEGERLAPSDYKCNGVY